MTPQQAAEMIEQLSKTFSTTVPELRLDCMDCFGNPNVLACYKIHESSVCLRSDLIHPRLVKHEFAHHLYRSYYGDQCGWWNPHCPSDAESEGFARWFEELDVESFRCQVCGNTFPWRVLDDMGFKCLNCKSVYDIV